GRGGVGARAAVVRAPDVLAEAEAQVVVVLDARTEHRPVELHPVHDGVEDARVGDEGAHAVTWVNRVELQAADAEVGRAHFRRPRPVAHHGQAVGAFRVAVRRVIHAGRTVAAGPNLPAGGALVERGVQGGVERA